MSGPTRGARCSGFGRGVRWIAEDKVDPSGLSGVSLRFFLTGSPNLSRSVLSLCIRDP